MTGGIKMLSWLKRKYDAACERIEAGTAKMRDERLALEAARKEREAVDKAIAKADKLLDKN